MSADRLLEEGYRRCASIARRHGQTYYWGSRLLPRERRRHVHAVYALARLADDIVDRAGSRPGPGTAAALQDLERRFRDALAEGGSADPVLAAVTSTVRECHIPAECFERFFAAMRADLTTLTYETWEDLLAYMDGSAAVIGEMMLPVLGPLRDATAPARQLGLAFQLTNFLRDVGEDLDRGRVYVPQEDLRRFGADPHTRRVTEEWRALMRFEIERNRRLYREADTGLAALPPRSRRCVATARVLYARILERIEANDYDVFTARARVGTASKALLAARMTASRDVTGVVRRDRAAALPDRDAWTDDDRVVLVDEQGRALGAASKSAVHHDDTPLHLGFSCYLFDSRGRLLVTTRARSKPSFPGVLTNSVCGHPRPGQDLMSAVRGRVRRELGLEVRDLRLVLADFRYRASMDGLVENELCPVLVGWTDGAGLAPDPTEVDATTWVSWEGFGADVAAGRLPVSPWCAEQVPLLRALGPDPGAWPPASRDLLPAVLRSLDEG